MRTIRFVLSMAALLLLAFTSGCGSSPNATFYTLTALAPESSSTSSASLTISVGPVTLPALDDRPQLVIRTADNKVDLLEFHRWAAPLTSELPRMIAQNLSRLLRPARVFVYDQSPFKKAQYRVLMDIQRFEAVPGAGVTIEALWSIRRNADGSVVKAGHSLVHQPVEKPGYSAVVAAYSRALASICGNIAKTFRKQQATGAPH